MTAAVYRLSLRALLRGRRALVVALIALIPVVSAVGQRASDAVDPQEGWTGMIAGLVIPTVAAFVAVILGATAIGDDREDGTILQLVATTLPRLGLSGAKAVAAWSAAVVVLVPATVVSGVVILEDEATAGSLLWPALAVALVALCYAAAFTWIALLTRRAIAVGAVYVLLWEGSLATFAEGIERLSIGGYGRSVAAPGLEDFDRTGVSPAAGVIVLLALSALFVALAARRLRRMDLP